MPPTVSGTADMQGLIYAYWQVDLDARVNVFQTQEVDLSSYVRPMKPYDLPALMHGWDERDLPATLLGEFGPGDIQASVYAIPPANLAAMIEVFLGIEVPRNLFAIVIGTFSQDLPAAVQPVTPTDLQAFINVTGQSENLPATIVPKVIFMSQVLQVSLLEHKNLRAMINSACFSSDSRNLYAYIRSIEKLDLQGIIFGWHVDIYSNAKDLRMYINTEDYYVEDKAAPWFFADDEDLRYSRLKLTFTTTGPSYDTFDTLQVFYERPPWENLQGIITGILEAADLGASLTAVFDFNFSELPHFVSPRTREVVIEFDDRWREKWRRFVELFFDDSGNTPYHYFYVSGANKVYRVDRRRHWTIWAKGYDEVDSMIEHRNARYKYIFNASRYANVDEAIRDLIDRVSAYRRVNLSAQIYGILPDHINLGASIRSLISYSWVKHLNAYIKGKIAGAIEGTSDMHAKISTLHFNFTEEGYTPPSAPFDFDFDFDWPYYE